MRKIRGEKLLAKNLEKLKALEQLQLLEAENKIKRERETFKVPKNLPKVEVEMIDITTKTENEVNEIPQEELNESMSVMLDESRSVFPCMHAALTRMCHVRGARTDKCFIPALFAHADGDDFVLAHLSKHLYERYSGDKNIITFGGDHNSPRPAFFFDSVGIFFYNVLIENAEVEAVEKAAPNIVLVATDNLIDRIWDDQPAPPAGKAIPHPIEFAGEKSGDKRTRIAAAITTSWVAS